MDKTILLALLIPGLILAPYLLSENAYAYKVTDQEIKIEVVFYKDEGQNPNLVSLYNDLDDGLIEQNIFETFQNNAIGQWSVNNIVADWGINVNFDTGEHKLQVNPIITEINLPNGVNFPSVQDILIDDGRDIITTKLQNYGINSFTWYLYYQGGLVIEEQTIP